MRVSINGKKIVLEGKWVRTARLEEEWYEDADNPEALIEKLRSSREQPDVFTFWQRLPDVTPRYPYVIEHDAIAALPVKNYSHWWEKQISAKTRNMVRRAEKKGVLVKPSNFDDEFVRGVVAIFNETPIRQGKRFWHYGKDAEIIKRDFSRFLSREEIFGAYVGDELIGFIMLAFSDEYICLGQILSKIAHRDKAPTNALMAKAVERCAEKGISYLVYSKWVDGSLGDFKRHNGFEKIDLPRYFVPLSFKGRCYLALKLHRGASGLIPSRILEPIKEIRKRLRERMIHSAPKHVSVTQHD